MEGLYFNYAYMFIAELCLTLISFHLLIAFNFIGCPGNGSSE